MEIQSISGVRTKLVSAVCIAVLLMSGCRVQQDKTATRTLFQMSTVITLQVVGPDAEAVCDALSAAIIDLENTFSMFLEESDISRINAAAGSAAVAIKPETANMLLQATAVAAETGGLFDVTVGAVTALWGVTTEHPRVPAQSEIDAALPLIDASGIAVTESNGSYTAGLAAAGMKIDPGGIAKGYALDLCYAILEKSGTKQAILSIGGNVLVYKNKNGGPYTVGIRYPVKDSEGYFCAVQVEDTIVSTTGGYERFFEQDGVSYHHVFDPRTGYPADSDILSVSVVQRNGLRADCTSTALFVAGLEKTLEQMRAGTVEAIVMDYEGHVYVTKSLYDRLAMDLCDTENYTFIAV